MLSKNGMHKIVKVKSETDGRKKPYNVYLPIKRGAVTFCNCMDFVNRRIHKTGSDRNCKHLRRVLGIA